MTENSSKKTVIQDKVKIYSSPKQELAAQNVKNQYIDNGKNYNILLGMINGITTEMQNRQNQQNQIQQNQQNQIQQNQQTGYRSHSSSYNGDGIHVNVYVNDAPYYSSGQNNSNRQNTYANNNNYNTNSQVMPEKVNAQQPILLSETQQTLLQKLKNIIETLRNIAGIPSSEQNETTKNRIAEMRIRVIQELKVVLSELKDEKIFNEQRINDIMNYANKILRPAKQDISDNKITEKDNVNSEAKKEKNKEIDDDTRRKEDIKKAFRTYASSLKNKSNFFKKAFNKFTNYFFKNSNDEMTYDIVFANMSYPAKRYCKEENILSNGIIDKNITKNITKEIHKCINEYNKSNDNSYNGYKEQLENEIANLSLQIQEQIKQNFDIEEEAKLNVKNINNKKVQKNLGELQDFNKQLQGATQNLNSKIKTKQSQQQR